MHVALAALTAAQLLIGAPLDLVGTNRAQVASRLGQPLSTGIDYKEGPDGTSDKVVTLDYPMMQIRLHETPSASTLLSLVTVDERFGTRTAVHVGVDRGTVLREMGGPAYEDDDQIIYVEPRPDNPASGDRVRLIIREDHVIGIEWNFAPR